MLQKSQEIDSIICITFRLCRAPAYEMQHTRHLNISAIEVTLLLSWQQTPFSIEKLWNTASLESGTPDLDLCTAQNQPLCPRNYISIQLKFMFNLATCSFLNTNIIEIFFMF